jgi:condensin complex subunit 1
VGPIRRDSTRNQHHQLDFSRQKAGFHSSHNTIPHPAVIMSSSSQPDTGGGDGVFVLADELIAYREEGYIINNEVDASSLPTYLDGLVDSLSLSPSSIEDEQTFDQIKSFLRHFSTLSGPQRSKLLDALTSAYGIQIDAAARDLETEGIERYKDHANTLEKYAFSLQWFIHAAEKASTSREERSAAAAAASSTGNRAGAGKAKAAAGALSGWDWQRAISTILHALTKSLRLSTSILFPLSASRDAFISGCVLRPVLLLQENEAHLKVPAIKLSIFKVICNCVKNHAQAFAVQTSIMQALAYYEHLAEPMAELLALLRLEFDYERLGDEVLREVAARDFGGLDTKGPRCFARFLVRMAELSPRSVLRVISLLNKHLDSEVSETRLKRWCEERADSDFFAVVPNEERNARSTRPLDQGSQHDGRCTTCRIGAQSIRGIDRQRGRSRRSAARAGRCKKETGRAVLDPHL